MSALLLVIFASLYAAFQPGTMDFLGVTSRQTSDMKQVRINEVLLNVEVADSAGRRAQGLSGRESLASDSGMLFVFPESKKYQFWMKGMKFPLDLIFIRNGKVVDLLANVSPPASGQAESSLTIYEPVVQVDMLLETNAGFIEANRIRIGDIIYRLNP